MNIFWVDLIIFKLVLSDERTVRALAQNKSDDATLIKIDEHHLFYFAEA